MPDPICTCTQPQVIAHTDACLAHPTGEALDWSPWTSCYCDRASSGWCEHLTAAWDAKPSDPPVYIVVLYNGQQRILAAKEEKRDAAHALADALASELGGHGYFTHVMLSPQGALVALPDGDYAHRNRR